MAAVALVPWPRINCVNVLFSQRHERTSTACAPKESLSFTSF